MAELCKALGYRASKMWGHTFPSLLTGRRALAEAATLIRAELHVEDRQNGRTQRDCAALLGISEQFLSDMANGKRVSAQAAAKMERVGWSGKRIYMAQAAEEFRAALAEQS